jgi:hypothetical protein
VTLAAHGYYVGDDVDVSLSFGGGRVGVGGSESSFLAS